MGACWERGVLSSRESVIIKKIFYVFSRDQGSSQRFFCLPLLASSLHNKSGNTKLAWKTCHAEIQAGDSLRRRCGRAGVRVLSLHFIYSELQVTELRASSWLQGQTRHYCAKSTGVWTWGTCTNVQAGRDSCHSGWRFWIDRSVASQLGPLPPLKPPLGNSFLRQLCSEGPVAAGAKAGLSTQGTLQRSPLRITEAHPSILKESAAICGGVGAMKFRITGALGWRLSKTGKKYG